LDLVPREKVLWRKFPRKSSIELVSRSLSIDVDDKILHHFFLLSLS
jgi:hypothetical protein